MFLSPSCSSSTFKDAERASLRDSGHGDSDQADSDLDTNKGCACNTSAREALKMKATAVNGQPLDQGEWKLSLSDIVKTLNRPLYQTPAPSQHALQTRVLTVCLSLILQNRSQCKAKVNDDYTVYTSKRLLKS